MHPAPLARTDRFRRRGAVAAALGCALAAAASAPAQAGPTTLSFQQGAGGYTGTQDTMIRSNETGSPGDSRNVNYGALTYVSVDGDDGSPGLKPNHGLLRFDAVFGTGPGRIGPLDTIVSATVTLTVFDAGSGMTVHDLLVDWQQGSATWNSLGNGVQADGVEAVAMPIATFGADNASANVPVGPLSFDVTASLRAVQSGTLPGYGWALLPFVNGTNGIDFRSSEYLADATARPLLTVQVTPVPEPGTWALLAAGLAATGLFVRGRVGV